MDKYITQCVINRAEAILKILKDVRKCESGTMIEYGYKSIEGLAGGTIKMLEREIKKCENKKGEIN